MLTIILKLAGLHAVLLGIFAVSAWMGDRLTRWGRTLLKTGTIPAHSWATDRPPHDITPPRLIGKVASAFVIFCGWTGYIIAFFAIVIIMLFDLYVIVSIAIAIVERGF